MAHSSIFQVRHIGGKWCVVGPGIDSVSKTEVPSEKLAHSLAGVLHDIYRAGEDNARREIRDALGITDDQ